MGISLDQTVTLAGIFLYGCMTSVHCMGMCGGIIMAVTVCEGRQVKALVGKQLAYHGGRLLTGTLWGIILGLAGQIISINPYMGKLIPVVCGGMMVFMGLMHLGVISKMPSRVPGRAVKKLYSRIQRKGALPAGILSGLLPCGALHTAQLCAAGSSNVVEAVLYMLCFILGTIPMLFVFGLCHAVLTGTAQRITLKVSGVLTVLLGIRLLWRSLM